MKLLSKIAFTSLAGLALSLSFSGCGGRGDIATTDQGGSNVKACTTTP